MAAVVNNMQNIDINKSKAIFNMKAIRILLIAITTILIVLSLAMLVVSNMAYWYYHSYALFFESDGMRSFITPSALSTFIGSVLFLVCLFGFYGTYKKSTCMVNSYACILFVLLILKLVAVCLTYTFDKDAIWKQFEIPIWNMNNADIWTKVDYLQSTLGCCGNSYYTDYAYMEFPSDMSTVTVAIPESPAILELPASCCAHNYGGFCSNVWPDGCKYVLLHSLDTNAITIGVLALSVMIINLLGIIFALLLAQSIRKMKSENAFLSWKLKEQIIFARMTDDFLKNSQINNFDNNQQANMA